MALNKKHNILFKHLYDELARCILYASTGTKAFTYCDYDNGYSPTFWQLHIKRKKVQRMCCHTIRPMHHIPSTKWVDSSDNPDTPLESSRVLVKIIIQLMGKKVPLLKRCAWTGISGGRGSGHGLLLKKHTKRIERADHMTPYQNIPFAM